MTWRWARGPSIRRRCFARSARTPGTRPMSSHADATDGRYGENPNRLGHYYQYQVVLKPSPENLQDLYLGSLVEIGIDPLKHDIRFVEDDWESPTLGAWGLGWEVWCDGMEVTQFTYFQQVGGFECRPVSRRAHLRPRAPRHVHSGRRQCFRPQVQRCRRHLSATCSSKMRSRCRPIISRSRTPTPCSTCSARPPRSASAACREAADPGL